LLLDPTISYTDLPLLIGVLYDWVKNCRDGNLQFCEVVTYPPTKEMAQKEKEIISPQDDVSGTEKVGQQADNVLPKRKRKRRKAKKKHVSTENVIQVEDQSRMVVEGGVLNDDDSESHSKIPGSSQKRGRDSVGKADDKLKKKSKGNLSN